VNPYYLKFTDEAHAIAAMQKYRMDDQWEIASLTHALDLLGAIEGVDGYHINLMVDDLPTDLEPFLVTPDSPVRVFAGVI